MNKMDLLKRFEEKFCPEPNTGCWLWDACSTRRPGYFPYGTMRNENKRMEKAHRISYRLFIGDIPDGLIVRHKCDTTLCVNPDHLLIGTPKENVNDRYVRGRDFHFNGSTHPMAKFTEEDIKVIRKAIYNGTSQKELAKIYGVTPEAIGYVKVGWKHVKTKYDLPRNPRGWPKGKKRKAP